MRIAVLSSYTIDLVVRSATERLSAQGFYADWYVAPFGQYNQEILASSSRDSSPLIVILALHAEEWLRLASGGNFDQIVELLRRASRNYSGSTLLVQNVVQLRPEPLHYLQWHEPNSQRYLTAKVNCVIADCARELPNLYVLDVEGLALRYGAEKLFDPRLHYLAGMEFGTHGTQIVGNEIAAAIAALVGPRSKCLVLDLDNTLWGGVLGDEGIEHIQLGHDGLGKAFHDFQRHILRLHASGTLLAICSKNDEAHALEAIEQHPDMQLRKRHFAAWRINWRDKVENLRAIAEELNIGCESLVFLDDSPHERELVRAFLPEVAVPDLPTDPSDYADTLARLPHFDTFALTAEDSLRGEMYGQERQRKELLCTADSLESFLKTLAIRVRVQPADQFSIPRIAQLTQKTNQFNLTTQRYTEAALRKMSESQTWRVLSIAVTDRFGDSGIVGTAIFELDLPEARLDTFLVSCRVLGRGIERALLHLGLEDVRELGANSCRAEFLPTKRNSVADTFLSTNGFAASGANFTMALDGALEIPRWIEVIGD